MLHRPRAIDRELDNNCAIQLKHPTGREVAAGSIYIILDRLEAKGLVTSRVGESTPERGGRAKTYYQITGKGCGLFATRNAR